MNDKPEKPSEEDCCGSGCKPCIFDIYEEKLKKWKEGKLKLCNCEALDQIKYLPFIISAIESISDSLKIFKFQAVKLLENQLNDICIKNSADGINHRALKDFLDIKAGEYLILKGLIESEEENKSSVISRSYTPVLDKSEFEIGTFTVIISLLPEGEMSQFIRKLQIQDIVFWRGPYKEFEYSRNSFQNLLLIGGGTGVVPLYNLSKSILADDKDETIIHMLCSYKNIHHILLRNQLHQLKEYWNFMLKIFISNHDNSSFQAKYNETIVLQKIDEGIIYNEVKNLGSLQFFVIISGPKLFNDAIKKYLLKLDVKEENIHIFWYFQFLFFWLPKVPLQMFTFHLPFNNSVLIFTEVIIIILAIL